MILMMMMLLMLLDLLMSAAMRCYAGLPDAGGKVVQSQSCIIYASAGMRYAPAQYVE